MVTIEKVTQCSCVQDINKKLEPEHTLNVGMFTDQAIIGLIRKDKWDPEKRRGKPRFILASYCPFCGVKYKLPESAAQSG